MVLLKRVFGRQKLKPEVLALLNCILPLVLRTAEVYGWLYRLKVKGSVTVMTALSACEPATRFVPGTTVAPVEGW
jgi:hypothetical protein